MHTAQRHSRASAKGMNNKGVTHSHSWTRKGVTAPCLAHHQCCEKGRLGSPAWFHTAVWPGCDAPHSSKSGSSRGRCSSRCRGSAAGGTAVGLRGAPRGYSAWGPHNTITQLLDLPVCLLICLAPCWPTPACHIPLCARPWRPIPMCHSPCMPAPAGPPLCPHLAGLQGDECHVHVVSADNRVQRAALGRVQGGNVGDGAHVEHSDVWRAASRAGHESQVGWLDVKMQLQQSQTQKRVCKMQQRRPWWRPEGRSMLRSVLPPLLRTTGSQALTQGRILMRACTPPASTSLATSTRCHSSRSAQPPPAAGSCSSASMVRPACRLTDTMLPSSASRQATWWPRQLQSGKLRAALTSFETCNSIQTVTALGCASKAAVLLGRWRKRRAKGAPRELLLAVPPQLC